MLLHLSHFFLPFIPLHPAAHLPPAFPPPLSLCPQVVAHINSLASLFLILFLTPPVYFEPTIYASYSLYLLPHSLLPPPCWYPFMWSPCLWFCSCSSCLLSFLFCFVLFLGLIVNSYESVVILLFIFLIFFFFLDESL